MRNFSHWIVRYAIKIKIRPVLTAFRQKQGPSDTFGIMNPWQVFCVILCLCRKKCLVWIVWKGRRKSFKFRFQEKLYFKFLGINYIWNIKCNSCFKWFWNMVISSATYCPSNNYFIYVRYSNQVFSKNKILIY